MLARSLLDLFRPPGDLVGQFGIVTAYCGTADFLEDAVSVFSRLARRRRESLGHPFLFLLLDAHRTAERVRLLKPNEVPGVFELPPRRDRHPELFHAKVGLLAFGEVRGGRPSHLRLVVTTGNWTQASARRQLELAWQLDVPVVNGQLEGPWMDRADFGEAAAFFTSALQRYGVAPTRKPQIDALLQMARSNPSEFAAKRFIHSLKPAHKNASGGTPLYDQILKLAPHDRSDPRDVLMCGSGFYERPGKGGAKPEVLARLESLPGLKPGKRVAIARPQDAGALAKWKGDRDGWLLLGAVDGQGAVPRSLHAKFIYVGRRWGQATRDGWLYLGSGNLTKRGLLLAPSTGARGNVEAGVILGVSEKLDAEALASKLFVDLEGEPFEPSEMASGHDEDQVLAKSLVDTPPILMAEEVEDEAGGRQLRLYWAEPTGAAAVLSWPGVEIHVPHGTQFVPLVGPCPSMLTVASDGKELAVPVEDANGRLCRVPLSPMRFEDALADLLNYPVPDADEDENDDDENGEGDEDDEAGGQSQAGDGDDGEDEDGDSEAAAGHRSDEEAISYPLQEGMELLERVGQLQSLIPPHHLLDWFRHLESRLIDCLPARQIKAWRELAFPLLATLAKPAFRAPNMTNEQSKAYMETLRRVARKWEVPL